MSNSNMDAGIPLLTEVIPTPSPAASIAEAAQPLIDIPPPDTHVVQGAPVAVIEQEEELITIDAPPDIGLDDEQLLRLENEIRERVLHQVLERIDFVLEQRVRDSLADVLQTAVEGLANDIRDGLHQSMRDVITRAVTQEINKLQSAKK